MIRETTLEAFEMLIETGLRSRLKRETITALRLHGPCTAGELHERAGWNIKKNNHNISSRLGELRDLGWVREVGKRPCSTTGNSQIVWDLAENVPYPKPKQDRTKCPTCSGHGYIEQARLL